MMRAAGLAASLLLLGAAQNQEQAPQSLRLIDTQTKGALARGAPGQWPPVPPRVSASAAP